MLQARAPYKNIAQNLLEKNIYKQVMDQVMDWMDHHPNPTRSLTLLSITCLTQPFNQVFT